MRRKDRQLNEKEAYEIIDNCQYGVISCIDNGEIFSIPISIVRHNTDVFIHGAMSGSKAKLLKDGKNVELVCVSYAKVPEFSSEKFHSAISSGNASSVFTTEYKSAIAKTKAYEVDDENLQIYALKILSQKYTPNYMSAFDVAIKQSLKRTKIYRLDIISISAKAKII